MLQKRAKGAKADATLPNQLPDLMRRIDETMAKSERLSETVLVTPLDSLTAAELQCGQLEKQLKVLRQPLTEHMDALQFPRAQAGERRCNDDLNCIVSRLSGLMSRRQASRRILENAGQGDPRHQSS